MENIKLLVCVVNNNNYSQLKKTIDNLSSQTTLDFDLKILDMVDFWSEDRNKLNLEYDYVFFLYSGSILRKDAIEVIHKEIEIKKAAWYYCDENTFDAALNNNFDEVYEKADYGKFVLALNSLDGEGVIFSKAVLEKMCLKYTGSNFSVLISEMASFAASMEDGVHIRECLLTRHNRKNKNKIEKMLLTECTENIFDKNKEMIVFTNNLKNEITVNPRKGNLNISIVLLGDELPKYVSSFLGNEKKYELIIPLPHLSYHEKIINSIESANGEVICFIEDGFEFISSSSLSKMADYAFLPNSGIVSPCITDNKNIIYSGSFTIAGNPFRISLSDITEKMKREIFAVRETIFPANSIWMAKKNILQLLFSELQNENEEVLFSKVHRLMDYAYIVENMGFKNLYLGNILAIGHEVTQSSDDNFCYMLSKWKTRYLIDPYVPYCMKREMRSNVLNSLSVSVPSTSEYRHLSKKVLVLTHELSLTGAPIVLSHAVRILKEDGWYPVIVSPKDGELKKDFLNMGVPVIIYDKLDDSSDWIHYFSGFDLIIVNTVVPFKQINQLSGLKIPVMWWLHDAKSGYEVYLQHVLPETLGNNIFTYSVSKYADDVVKEYRPNYQTELLLYGLKDESKSVLKNCNLQINGINEIQNKKLFVNVGTIINRKGQDIMAEAIRLLPEDVRNNSLFLFIGRPIDNDIFVQVKNLEKDFPENVYHIDAIAHDDIFSLYKDATAVICSSRDDPLPTFMAETMMVSGVCICSENTGTAGVIRNGFNGYVYKNNNPVELADCITNVFYNDNLGAIRSEARSLFEGVFSYDIFRKNLLMAISKCVDWSG